VYPFSNPAAFVSPTCCAAQSGERGAETCLQPQPCAWGLSVPAGALPCFGLDVFLSNPRILTSELFSVSAGFSHWFLPAAAACQPQPCCGAVQHRHLRRVMAQHRVGGAPSPPPACASPCPVPMSGQRTCHTVRHSLSTPFQHQCDAPHSVPAVLRKSRHSCSHSLI